jgi:hypothetical protein
VSDFLCDKRLDISEFLNLSEKANIRGENDRNLPFCTGKGGRDDKFVNHPGFRWKTTDFAVDSLDWDSEKEKEKGESSWGGS